MTRKIIALSAMLWLLIFTVFAQEKKAVITFTKTTHDYGTISETGGSATTEFEFTNTGNAPLLITRTAASCGCTTPEYPKEPIAPGRGGSIKVTFNPKNRPGAFQKTVYVFSNAQTERFSLTIIGNVVQGEKSKEEIFSKEIGALKLERKTVPFHEVYLNIPKTEVIAIYNSGPEQIGVELYEVPKHIKATAIPSKLKPNEEGRIEITYFSEKAKDWGVRDDFFRIAVVGNSRVTENNKINLRAEIQEDYSLLTQEQREKAPKISFSEKTVNFGEVKGRAVKSIMIHNSGKTTLNIRKIASEHSLISFSLSKKAILPGGFAELKVTVTGEKEEPVNIHSRLIIYSNDVANSSIPLKVNASIK